MTRIATFAALATLAAMASACALADRLTPEPRVAQADMPGQIEPVHSAAIARDQAVFRVTSNGCTTKADITPVVRQSNEGPILTLRRIKEDRCRETLPDGELISWSFEELGLAPGTRLSVEAPYQLPPG